MSDEIMEEIVVTAPRIPEGIDEDNDELDIENFLHPSKSGIIENDYWSVLVIQGATTDTMAVKPQVEKDETWVESEYQVDANTVVSEIRTITAEELSADEEMLLNVPYTRFIYSRKKSAPWWSITKGSRGIDELPIWQFVGPYGEAIRTKPATRTYISNIRGPAISGGAGHPIAAALVIGLMINEALDTPLNPLVEELQPEPKLSHDARYENPFNIIFNEIDDGAWVETDKGDRWQPQPRPEILRVPGGTSFVYTNFDPYLQELTFEISPPSIRMTPDISPFQMPGRPDVWTSQPAQGQQRWRIRPSEDLGNHVSTMIEGEMENLVGRTTGEELRPAQEKPATSDQETSYREEEGVLPEVEVQTQTKADGKTQIRVRVRTRNKAEKPKLRKSEKKAKSQRGYIALLHFINRVWGRPSEVIDFINVWRHSIEINGKGFEDATWDEFLTAYGKADSRDIVLDMEKFIMGLLYEAISDALIGKFSRMENKFLGKILPANHPLRNMMGNPSTWLKRLGVDILDIPLSVLKDIFEPRLQGHK